MNYFDFLPEEVQKYIEDNRFTGLNDEVLAVLVHSQLQELYNIDCVGVPIPTNHQIECFLKMKKAYREEGFSFALFMEQGLGKTKVALMMAEWLYRQSKIYGIIVIAPNNLKYQWVEEQIPLHYPGETESIIWDGFGTQKAKREFYRVINSKDRMKIMSINVEAFSSDSVKQYVHMFCKSCKDVLVIIDESTTIKNGRRRPKRSGKREGAKRTNLILDGFANRKYKMILTGTATPNRPFDLWSQFEFLRYNYFHKDYWDFCKYHGEMIQVRRSNSKKLSLELLDEETYRLVKYDLQTVADVNTHILDTGSAFPKTVTSAMTPWQLEEIALRRGITESGVMRISKMKELVQFKNLDQLREQITPITYFRKTTEVLDMPPQIYETLPCEMSGEQKKLYKEMKHNMMAEYDGDTVSTLYKQVMYIRCQQITGGLFPYPIEVIKKGLEEGRIVTSYSTKRINPNGKLNALSVALDDVDPDQSKIYWAWFTGEQELIYDMLCKKFGSSIVGLYRDNKKEVEQAFKGGEIKHFVSGDSGSFGLNLQISHLQYFYSNNHRADIRDQKEKRSHRMGQVNPVTYIDLVCRGSKDKTILEVLKRKMDLMEFFRKGENSD